MREIDRTLPPEGKSAAWEVELPFYPGDGTTQCGVNCKCSWHMSETKSETRAYWRLDSTAETCSDCNQRSVGYNPLTFTKDVA
jgi:hypothetical protein